MEAIKNIIINNENRKRNNLRKMKQYELKTEELYLENKRNQLKKTNEMKESKKM